MKVAWAILLISALTDFIVGAGTALTAASVETSWIPGKGAILVSLIGGLVAAARTIQQELKRVRLKVDLAGNPIEPTTPNTGGHDAIS